MVPVDAHVEIVIQEGVKFQHVDVAICCPASESALPYCI